MHQRDQGLAHIEYDRVLGLQILNFLLPLVELRGRVVRLRRAVADRQGQIESALESRILPANHCVQIVAQPAADGGSWRGKRLAGNADRHAPHRNRAVGKDIAGNENRRFGEECSCGCGRRDDSAQPSGLVFTEKIELRQHRVPGSFHFDTGVFQVQRGLLDLRPFLPCFFDRVLQRNVLDVGTENVRRGNDFNAIQRARKGILRNRDEQRGFVEQLRRLRLDESLLIGGELRLRGDDVQRSHRTDLELLFVVVVKLLIGGDSHLLDLDVLASEHQLPVIGSDLGDRGNHLLREQGLPDFYGVFRFDNVPRVGDAPETVQERLG